MHEKIILSIHLVAGITWIGSVFMGAFIDWPSAKESMPENEFPFRFIIGQAKRDFYSVYFAITMLWSSSIALFIVHPPQSKAQIIMVSLKGLCLFLMTVFTLHGTFDTWPKLQLATNKEAFKHYKFYMLKAYGTFSFGIIGALLTLWSY